MSITTGVPFAKEMYVLHNHRLIQKKRHPNKQTYNNLFLCSMVIITHVGK